ncbi:hypothetical protein BGZ74_009359 [Mortierella antarctica]|nr:hypothetical protein BGZ74_009359 [Mortierella antarctica]
MDPPDITPGTGPSAGLHTPVVFSSLSLELKVLVFGYLTKHELTIATRVSKYWNSICTPLIWKILSITNKNQFWLFTKWGLKQAVIKNGQHIRELNLNYLSLLNLFATPDYDTQPNIQYTVHCSNLQSLNAISPSGYTCGNEDQMVIELIKHNPLLQVAVIDLPYQKLSMRELAEVWGPNLRKIHLEFYVCPCVAKRLLESMPESLQEVSLRLGPDKTEKEHRCMSTTSEKLRPHHYLRSINIIGSFDGYQEYVFLPFLTSCSDTLKEFKCPLTRCYLNKMVGAALARLGIAFKTLHIGELPDGCDSTDAAIAEVISSNLQLTSVDIGGCHMAERLAAAAILSIAANLEHLDVRGTGYNGGIVHAILCQARNLKSITLMEEYYSAANDAVELWDTSQGWVCTSLELFRGKISVSRPRDEEDVIDNEDDDEDLGPITIDESHESQRRMYHQLAQLTQLQELYLGQPLYPGDNDGMLDYYLLQQQDCLEMSLESGLEELASLKELRVLDVSNMDHRITDAERKWMRTYWPKFEELRDRAPCYDDEETIHGMKWRLVGELEEQPCESEEDAGSADDRDDEGSSGSLEDGSEWKADSVEEDSDLEDH